MPALSLVVAIALGYLIGAFPSGDASRAPGGRARRTRCEASGCAGRLPSRFSTSPRRALWVGLAAAAITLVALDAVRLVQRRVARALSPMPVDGLTTVPQ